MPKIIMQPKETILKVARGILETDGYSALSIRALAIKSGVSVGTIYNYFHDKNTLDHYLMSAFWHDFELAVETICRNDQIEFFAKLDLVHRKMAEFMQLFQTLFSSAIENREYQYSERDRQEKNAMLTRISMSLEKALISSYPTLNSTDLTIATTEEGKDDSFHETNLSAAEITTWILNSLMMVSHLRSMTYEELVKIIRRVISAT